VPLPNADLAGVRDGYTTAQILGNPRLRMMSTSYVFQAGQPDEVRQAFADAMGVEPQEFRGLGG
jgi:5,5'-dehydrodivanillate O-demethylase